MKKWVRHDSHDMDNELLKKELDNERVVTSGL